MIRKLLALPVAFMLAAPCCPASRWRRRRKRTRPPSAPKCTPTC